MSLQYILGLLIVDHMYLKICFPNNHININGHAPLGHPRDRFPKDIRTNSLYVLLISPPDLPTLFSLLWLRWQSRWLNTL